MHDILFVDVRVGRGVVGQVLMPMVVKRGGGVGDKIVL